MTDLDKSLDPVFTSDIQKQVREIGHTAVWSVSSCKMGFGVQQLCDNDLRSYWQSDGPQPHLIGIQFHKRTTVRFVSIYTDYKSDESYTPNKLSIQIGNDPHDLRQIEMLELDEPSGWINVDLEEKGRPVKTFYVQIAILGNHQNGRDTHLRQIKIYAPKYDTNSEKMPSIEQLHGDAFTEFSCKR